MAASSAALSRRLPVWWTPPVVALPVLINPQIVNISACYTASALMLFLFCGTWIELKDRDHSSSPWPHAICTGLVYAAIVALKTSYLLLPVVHFSVLSLGLVVYGSRLKGVFSWAIKVVISSVFFVLPWLMVYLSNLSALFSSRSYPHISFLGMDYFKNTAPMINPFSLEPLFWGFGDSLAYYTSTILLIGFCGIIFIVFQSQGYLPNKASNAAAIATCFTPPILYGANVFLISPTLIGLDTSLRYLCPIMIAAAPSATIIAATSVSEAKAQFDTQRRFVKKATFVIAFFSLLVLGAFSGSFIERVKQAATYGSILSFGHLVRNPKNIEYNHYVFSKDAKEKVQTAQHTVPKYKSLAVWTSMGLYLDYKRNPIVNIEPAGLITPWADFPFGQGTEEGISYFRTLGIEYVFWQYSGYAVWSEQLISGLAASPYKGLRMTGVRTHQFLEFLANVAGQSEILYDDGSCVILRLPSSTTIR
jgi:hypothetical protein